MDDNSNIEEDDNNNVEGDDNSNVDVLASNVTAEEANLDDVDSTFDDEDDDIGELQRFMEDDEKIAPEDRTAHMITLCFVYIDGFTTDIFPFNHKLFNKSKKMHKPSRLAILKEIKRRLPNLRGHKNKSIPDLQAIIHGHDNETPLPAVDKEYLQKFLDTYKDACKNRIEEQNNEVEPNSGSSPRITTDDRLRLIEALLCDEAKTKLSQTQECLTRQELDARNSEQSAADYFDVVSSQFNDPGFLPSLFSIVFSYLAVCEDGQININQSLRY